MMVMIITISSVFNWRVSYKLQQLLQTYLKWF